MKTVVFAGADETAEIAYITLQETRLVLVNVVDDDLSGENFFGRPVRPLQAVKDMRYDVVVVTSYLKRKQLYKQLNDAGVDKGSIRAVLS